MTLLDLLKAAAGEVSLHSRIGQWMLSVSTTADQSSAASFPDYLNARRGGSDQAGIGLNNNVIYNFIGANRGIAYLADQGVAFLTRGKTYRISAHIGADTFSAGVNGSLTIQLVNGANIPLGPQVLVPGTGPMDSPKAVLVPPTSTSDNTGITTIDFIYQVPTNATLDQTAVKMRCTAATGTATIRDGEGSLLIVEIPGGVPAGV